MPGDDQLLEIALRVLSAFVDRERPDAADIAVLRNSVSGPESILEPDALAVHVIQRELHKRRVRGANGA